MNSFVNTVQICKISNKDRHEKQVIKTKVLDIIGNVQITQMSEYECIKDSSCNFTVKLMVLTYIMQEGPA